MSGSSSLLAFSSVKTSSSEWHHRLEHTASSILKHIVSRNKLDLSSSLSNQFSCNTCPCNKSHKLPFSTSTIVSNQPLAIIFSDFWNPHDSFKYYVIFVDHFKGCSKGSGRIRPAKPTRLQCELCLVGFVAWLALYAS